MGEVDTGEPRAGDDDGDGHAGGDRGERTYVTEGSETNSTACSQIASVIGANVAHAKHNPGRVPVMDCS